MIGRWHKRWLRCGCTAALAALAAPHAAPAQEATEPEPDSSLFGDVQMSGSWRLRAENWHWFKTPGFDDSYTFGGSLVRVALDKKRPRQEWRLELAQPTLLGVPDNSVRPLPQGPLGYGGDYFAANGRRDGSFFPKQAFVRFNGVLGRHNALRLGRFEFNDGEEVMPRDPGLATLKTERLGQRLLGSAEFSHVGRSFDGVHFDRSTPNANFTAMVGRPTTGVYDLNGWDDVNRVDVAYAAYTRPRKHSDTRLFALRYRDRRGFDLTQLDNRSQEAVPPPADTSDIDITTIGAHYVTTFKAGPGHADVLVWGAKQSGDWGELDHDTYAVLTEAGYRFAWAKFNPWLRVGYTLAAGDGTSNDDRHHTFFPVLPSQRRYAPFPFYNMMNNEEHFAELTLRPSERLTVRVGARRTRLNKSSDLWYNGSGAFQDDSFGYVGRNGPGGNLAKILDFSIERQLSQRTSLSLYYASAQAGTHSVVPIYPGAKNAHFGYVEVTQGF